MQTAKSILITAFIIAFSFTSLVSYAEDIPQVIILFDQSGSIKKYDPRLASKECLMSFTKTIMKPCRIVLAGFDEEIHEHISVDIKADMSMDALAAEIEEIDARGRCTDLEAPFGYLLELENSEAVRFVLIVSDGEPDIWDGKLRYFSKRIKSDSRYEDLNKQYRALKALELSPDELYDRLRHLYHNRNLELIEQQVSRLKDGLGERIVLWDLSGESEFLKGWAEKSGAHYLAIKAEENVTPVDQLRDVTLSVLKKSGSRAREPPVRDRETRFEPESPASLEQKPLAPEPKPQIPTEPRPEIRPAPKPEVAPEQKPETPQTIVTSQAPPSPESGREPEEPGKMIQKQATEDIPKGWTIPAVLALFVLICAFVIVLRRSRKKAQAQAHTQVAGEQWQRLTDTKDDQESLKDMVSASIEEVSDYISEYMSTYIDDEIKRATGEVEKLLDELMEEGGKALESDGQFSARTLVPPGAMEIHWTNEDGKKMSGQAVDITMDAVQFEAPGFSAKSIDRVVCPGLNVVFDIRHSRIHRKEGNKAVAVLEEFQGGADDSMKWVELLTSIDDRREERDHGGN